jgi:hypothetical protein
MDVYGLELSSFLFHARFFLSFLFRLLVWLWTGTSSYDLGCDPITSLFLSLVVVEVTVQDGSKDLISANFHPDYHRSRRCEY